MAFTRVALNLIHCHIILHNYYEICFTRLRFVNNKLLHNYLSSGKVCNISICSSANDFQLSAIFQREPSKGADDTCFTFRSCQYWPFFLMYKQTKTTSTVNIIRNISLESTSKLSPASACASRIKFNLLKVNV